MATPAVVLPVTWAVWWVSWMVAAAWSDRAVSRAPRQQQILYRAVAAAGALLLFGPYRHAFESEGVLWHTPVALGWACTAIACAGLAFTWWARLHLGRLWSASVGRKAGHRLVDTGPYGLVRHPIYTGITLAAIGTAAMRGTVAGWLGAAIMTLGWYIKLQLEERFLREQLGADAYDDYARRVPMLVPWTGTRRR